MTFKRFVDKIYCRKHKEQDNIVIVSCGILIIALCTAVSKISPSFSPGLPEGQMPYWTLTVLLAAAGGIYLFTVFISRNVFSQKSFICWIFGIGMVMRLVTFPSTPVLEDDFYRYFWDGAVLVHGQSPYKYAPQSIIDGEDDIPADLVRLAESSGDVIQNVNYPRLRTIYPPLSQAAFGLSYLISPWSLTAWRAVLLVFDLLAFFLLIKYGFSSSALLIYWWNPLLIKEIYNSCHLDIMLAPFLVLTMAAVCRNRHLLATAAVGTAVAVKLWPVLLMPVIIRRIVNKPKQLAASIFIISGFAVMSMLPFWISRLDSTSGLAAYSRQWQMNDGLYMILSWGIQQLTDFAGIPAVTAAVLPRMAAAFLVGSAALWTAFHSEQKQDETNPSRAGRSKGLFLGDSSSEAGVGRRFLLVTAVLFLFSPTQFPWYYLWMLPFLAAAPSTALLAYTMLLPIYYLRPWFEFHSMTRIFDYRIVWVQHGPVIFLLIFQWFFRKKTVF